MEVKDWSYEEYPEFTEEVEGALYLDTDGNETGANYIHDEPYLTEGGVKLTLQILRPSCRNTGENEVLPCLVYVQGSAWMEQYVYRKLAMLSRVADRGYVVAVVQYRHSGIAKFPAQAVDAMNAVRHMRANAARYGIDPDRILIGGDSSGGHTALFACLLKDLPQSCNAYPGVSAEVKGIITYYGASSVMADDSFPTTLNHHLPDSAEGMLSGGCNLREDIGMRRRLSVECSIDAETKLPPVLLFHGTKDRTVNPKTSAVIYRRLLETGHDAGLVYIRGADHGGPEFWTPAAVDIADRFLKRCLNG